MRNIQRFSKCFRCLQDVDGKTLAELTTDDEIKAMLGDLRIAQDFEKETR